MPSRVIVHLEPTGALLPVPPPHTGLAVEATFLASLSEGETDLSSSLQETRSPEPFALTPLLDERDRPAGESSDTVRLEVGVLVDSLITPSLQALAVTGNMQVARWVYRVAAVGMGGAEPFSDLNWTVFAPKAVLDGVTTEAIMPNREVAGHRLTMAEHVPNANVPSARRGIGTLTCRFAARSTAKAPAGLDALVCFSADSVIGDRTTIGMDHVLARVR